MLEKDSPRRVATEMPIAVVAVVAAVLVLRFVQLSLSAASPLTYQLGPDEDYYLHFAQAVLAGRANSPEFLFMDPLYGYLLAGVFRLTGPSVMAVYTLQCILDAATAFALLLIGRELNRPHAGLMAALLYGLTSTALMFTCSLLKEVWVAAFLSWWVLVALRIVRSPSRWVWFAFGAYCGLGVSLRSTLLLLVFAGLLLPLFNAANLQWPRVVARAGLLAGGALLTLAPWSLRNFQADGSLSPLPHNAGVVLHQAYNAQNPASAIWIPTFVNYLNPRETWRGYAAEAERRTGRRLRAGEVDAYWRAEALGYMSGHPAAVGSAIAAKAGKFFASTEIPINRSLDEEALFSPPIRLLPTAAPWLIALGLVGLATLIGSDRRRLIVALPVAVSFVTMAGFWAEDRFRYHAMPILALGAGLLVEYVASAISRRDIGRAAATSGAAALLLAGSFALGRSISPPPLHWDQIVWGYIKMGKLQEATLTADRVLRERPDDGAVWEAVGYLAVLRQDFAGAEAAYRTALKWRSRSDLAHYDLAKVLERLGRRGEALEEANRALALRDDPDYRQLADQLRN